MSNGHLSKQQLALLVGGDIDGQLEDEFSVHLAACVECQSALDAIAASPLMWEKAGQADFRTAHVRTCSAERLGELPCTDGRTYQ